MPTPLTVLQDLRRSIPKEESKTFEDFKIESLLSILGEITLETDKNLIQAIQNKPYLDTWNVFIIYRKRYTQFFKNIDEFVTFVETNLQPIEGFTATVSKDIHKSTDLRYPFSYVRIIFKEA